MSSRRALAAAEQIAKHVEDPRGARQQLRGLVKELAQRTRPLSVRLRDWQPWHVKRVAGKLQLGFIVVVCLLTLWGDGKMPGRCISGFQGGNKLEETWLWELRDEPEPLPEAEVFAAYACNRDELMRRPIEKEAQFLSDSCEKEVGKEVALRGVPESALVAKYGKRQFSAIPCFVAVQACGKKRRIDNAKKSKDNQATQYTEKFRLANAYAPALSAKMLFQAGRRLGLSEAQVWRLLDLESGGEDLPDAFRSIQVSVEFLRRNIVMLRHPLTGKLWFYQMLAALFGRGSSVYSFERRSAFRGGAQAAPVAALGDVRRRRVVGRPASAKGAGQALIYEFFDAIGTGLSPDKREWMSQTSTFLGVEHSFARLMQEDEIVFWPKEAIEQELRAQLRRFRETEQCSPGSASKFRGVAGFAAEAQFGQLGRAPMRPFKQRQYWDKPPWELWETMRRSMSFIETLLDLKLERRVRVIPDSRPALVIATDAQVEPGSWPGGGALTHDSIDGERFGGWLEFKEGALACWGLCLPDISVGAGRPGGKQPIQLCEAAMIPLTLIQWPERVRGRRIAWYIDSTSAMASFVKGASANEDLEKIVGLFWMLAWHLDVTVWFEGVDSDSNWSDGVSRDFDRDELAQELEFVLQEMRGPSPAWQGDWFSLWQMAAEASGSRRWGRSEAAR